MLCFYQSTILENASEYHFPFFEVQIFGENNYLEVRLCYIWLQLSHMAVLIF